MKSIIVCLFLSIFCFAETELDTVMNSKEGLKNIVSLETYVTSSSEGTVGSNKLTISLINKSSDNITFYILLDQPVILTNCDFVVKKEKNNFVLRMDSDCSKYLSLSGQKKYVTDIINRIEKRVEYVYNKGDI